MKIAKVVEQGMEVDAPSQGMKIAKVVGAIGGIGGGLYLLAVANKPSDEQDQSSAEQDTSFQGQLENFAKTNVGKATLAAVGASVLGAGYYLTRGSKVKPPPPAS